MFDALIKEVAARFGLGDKAGTILSLLLGLMFQKQGLGGFLNVFKQKGLASLVESWLGKGYPLAINATQLENVIGGGLLGDIVAKTGIARGPAAMALAHMLPKIVRAVAPDGNIPAGIPPAISAYLGGASAAATAAVSHGAEIAHAASGGGLKKWLPWIIVAILALVGWCSLRKPAQAPAPAQSEAPAPQPVVQANPKLMLANEAGKVSVSGSVADELTKTSILDALKASFGAENVSGDIGIDGNTKGANWLEKLATFLPDFRVPGAKLSFDGDNITLEGVLAQTDIDGLMSKLKSVFGEAFTITSAATAATAASAQSAAPQDAGQALAQMAAAGSVSGEALVNALNMALINFATGSSTISPESMELLKKAAAAIKAAPEGTKIEVGGHTDNRGNPEKNQALSEARAQAVVAALVGLGVNKDTLAAKGYGDSQPKESNDSEEGRAKNRRMEFSLM